MRYAYAYYEQVRRPSPDACEHDAASNRSCILLPIRRSVEDTPVSADAVAASCAPLSRCLPPQQTEGLWSVCLGTHPRAGKPKLESFHAAKGHKLTVPCPMTQVCHQVEQLNMAAILRLGLEYAFLAGVWKSRCSSSMTIHENYDSYDSGAKGRRRRGRVCCTQHIIQPAVYTDTIAQHRVTYGTKYGPLRNGALPLL